MLHSGSSYIPQLAYTEFQSAPHRIMVRDDLIGGSETELALQPAHSRRVSFNLGRSLSSAATLNYDGELTLEIADPLYSDDTRTQTLQPKIRGSQVGAANVFQFNTVIPSGNKPQLQIPVKIIGRYLKSRVSGSPVNVQLPLLSIQISDATTQLSLNTARTFTSDLLSFSGDSTRFKEVTDTLTIDLSRWNGRQIEVFGKLYLGTEREDVAVADVYDLRNGAIFKEILAKSTDDDDAEQIRSFALLPNYPNPFNPSTIIPFMVPRETDVEITIFDINGRLVKRLLSAQYPAGQHEVVWHGQSDAGIQVSSGIYFYRMKAEGFIKTRKFLLTK